MRLLSGDCLTRILRKLRILFFGAAALWGAALAVMSLTGATRDWGETLAVTLPPLIVCFMAGGLSIGMTESFPGNTPWKVMMATLIGMMIRFGIPMLAVVVFVLTFEKTQARLLLYCFVCFYVVLLPVEVFLTLPRSRQTNDISSQSPM